MKEIFMDIETFQFNTDAGLKKPSDYKNGVFSVALGHFEKGALVYKQFTHFSEAFDYLDTLRAKQMKLFFHNGAKYDNHYLEHFLINEHNFNPVTGYEQQDKVSGTLYAKIKENTKKSGQPLIEHRIKSKTNVDLSFTLNGKQYQTVDTLPRFGNMSLRALGKQLARYGIIDPDQTKTDMDYEKHNRPDDMTYWEAKEYAETLNVSKDDLEYIQNDIIILAMAWNNYSKLYPDFDKNKPTLTTNILNTFKSYSPLAEFQLTAPDSNYSDYSFDGYVFSEWLNAAYKGGLNYYNDNYIGKIIDTGVDSYDRNSSYPDAMFNEGMPTKIKDFSEEYSEWRPNGDLTFMHITSQVWQQMVSQIASMELRKAFYKRYNQSNRRGHWISSVDIKTLAMFGVEIKSVDTIAWVSFYTEPFGARGLIDDLYRTKTVGKSKTELIYNSPNDIVDTGTPIQGEPFSLAEINVSKTEINGVYGLPGLRSEYAIFYRYEDGTLERDPFGRKNSERNIAFSATVTAYAFKALLTPLSKLTGPEIDEAWVYADTDSIYIRSEWRDKIVTPELFDEYNLGKWKHEHTMDRFYVLNHKKYAYNDIEKGVGFRAGGIPASALNTDMPFEQFIETQFSPGTIITGNSSYLTKYGTIAIYPKEIVLELGLPHLDEPANEYLAHARKSVARRVDDDEQLENEHMVYIDTPYGSLSETDIYHIKAETTGTRSLFALMRKQNSVIL